MTTEHVGFTEEAIGGLPGQSSGLVRREYMLRGQFQASHGEKTKRLRRSPYTTRLDYLALVVDGSAPETGHGVMIPRNLKQTKPLPACSSYPKTLCTT